MSKPLLQYAYLYFTKPRNAYLLQPDILEPERNFPSLNHSTNLSNSLATLSVDYYELSRDCCCLLFFRQLEFLNRLLHICNFQEKNGQISHKIRLL